MEIKLDLTVTLVDLYEGPIAFTVFLWESVTRGSME